ncbi:hypothetical protein [Sinomonas albida]|uniref:hypothetical protein n=1 Tax=Sinomonas albida TaxID=369942 RepID=UPI003019C3DA
MNNERTASSNPAGAIGESPIPSSFREILSCRELAEGDTIEAQRNDMHFTGRVTEKLDAMDLFWAVSASGERRIIEFAEFRVRLAGDQSRSADGRLHQN